MSVRRFAVVGHSGLIGAQVVSALKRLAPASEISGVSLGSVDLTDAESARKLAPHLSPDTTVVLCAAIKRQLGDSPQTYARNTQILANVADLLAQHPVRRLVYVSSAAVYGEDIENLAIDEATPLNTRSYYGLSKITGEWILQRVVDGGAAASLGVVRPAMVYGPRDQSTSYGPSAFLTAAMAGQPITLWGDGSELREMIYVDDAAEVIAAYALSDTSGPLNVASGVSYSFRDALNAVAEVVGATPNVLSRERSKAKVDNRFDIARLRRLMPDMGFTPLTEGVRRTYRARCDAGLTAAAT